MPDPPLPPSGGRRTITSATASPHLRDLDLPALRRYRGSLREEEEKISYWRRLIHARVDLIRSGAGTESGLDVARLAKVLGDTGSGRAREALHRVRAADPMPELPDLAEVWSVPTEEVESQRVLEHLAVAEEQLTGYRVALHERIDEATAELIVRYRADPSLALSLLSDQDGS